MNTGCGTHPADITGCENGADLNRRRALGLAAGFLTAGALPAAASGPDSGPFRHQIRTYANHVVVSKRHRVMALMDGETELKKYRIHLGFDPQGHKTRYGDGRTPEGRYYIDRRNPRSEFYLSLGISYPNSRDVARAMAMGVNPGGDIFIHGGPTKPEDRRKRDWTAGCIAVTNEEIEEIWSLVPTGIPITILG